MIPNDPEFKNQGALQQTKPNAAWNRAKGKGVVVAVLDTQINIDHPDLAPNILRDSAGNVVSNDCVNIDDNGYVDAANGHGTHVAGIIAAVMNNEIGITGIAPEAKILPVRVLDGSKRTTITDNVLSSILGLQYAAQYAKENPDVKVIINASFGSPSFGGTYKKAIEELFLANSQLDDQVVIVAAAMNNSTDAQHFPAACNPENGIVVAVAAVDGENNRWEDGSNHGSNYGDWITLAAPGERVLSLGLSDEYYYDSGTSMAAAFVSGALAVILSGNDSLSPRQALQYLLDNTDRVGTNKNDKGPMGKGILNLSKAMQSVPSPPLPPILSVSIDS